MCVELTYIEINGWLSMILTQVAHQPQSNSLDRDIALLKYMEEEGMFNSDLSPSGGLHSFPSSSAIFNNDQSRIEEERSSWENLDFQQFDDEIGWQPQFESTIDDEMEFYGALFRNPDEHTNAGAEYRDNAWVKKHSQVVTVGDFSNGQ